MDSLFAAWAWRHSTMDNDELVQRLRKVEGIGAGWGLPILDGESLDVTCKNAADAITALHARVAELTQQLATAKADRNQLRADGDSWADQADMHAKDALTYLQRAERAEADLAAARADADRINWCEKQWADGIHIEYCAIGIGDVRVLPAGAVFLRNKEYKGDSIRSAIDAALAGKDAP
jgi:hypothetical protein